MRRRYGRSAWRQPSAAIPGQSLLRSTHRHDDLHVYYPSLLLCREACLDDQVSCGFSMVCFRLLPLSWWACSYHAHALALPHCMAGFSHSAPPLPLPKRCAVPVMKNTIGRAKSSCASISARPPLFVGFAHPEVFDLICCHALL